MSRKHTCVCAPGFYNGSAVSLHCFDMDYSESDGADVSDSTCYSCPHCATCPGPTQPILSPGWHAPVLPNEATNDHKSKRHAFLCSNLGACLQSGWLNDSDSCRTGHTGYLCQSCADGFHMSARQCIECDSTVWHRLLKRLLQSLVSRSYACGLQTFPAIESHFAPK